MATNDPSKMVGGADAFICDVVSDNGDGTWDVDPRIVEVDGTDHPTITVNAVGGIKAQSGDVVLVETVRNNLDDKKISRFYPPTESNGRIIAVAKPVTQYVFEGDYKFEGDVLFDGNVTVNENLTVEKDLTVKKNLKVEENAEVSKDLKVTENAEVGGLKIGGIDWLAHVHPNNAPAPGNTGPGTQVGP